jgi:hypothetical protein
MLPETRDHTSFFSFYDGWKSCHGWWNIQFVSSKRGSMRYSVLAITSFFIVDGVYADLARKQRKSA